MKEILLISLALFLCNSISDYLLFKHRESGACQGTPNTYFYHKGGVHFCPSVVKVTIYTEVEGEH